MALKNKMKGYAFTTPRILTPFLMVLVSFSVQLATSWAMAACTSPRTDAEQVGHVYVSTNTWAKEGWG